jgi:hypothetical protein
MSSDYSNAALSAARLAISKGHKDPANLRELLIWTTSASTSPIVDEYFSQHYEDGTLLVALIDIALEGDDMGDAPWAAANTIADFPAHMLREHIAALVTLSEYDWMYLKQPALKALAKLSM